MPCRRPAPSILFTALAATVVLLPWALNGAPGDDESPAAAAPRMVQQPLADLRGGETIREIHQDEPFSMVALTSEDLTGTSARMRAKKGDGSWGPWYEAEQLGGVGADLPGPRGTEPVFIGRTNTVQISVTRAAPPAAGAKAGPDLDDVVVGGKLRGRDDAAHGVGVVQEVLPQLLRRGDVQLGGELADLGGP